VDAEGLRQMCCECYVILRDGARRIRS